MHSIHPTPSLSTTHEVIPEKQPLATPQYGRFAGHSSQLNVAAFLEWDEGLIRIGAGSFPGL
jgi:hypothetical protein